MKQQREPDYTEIDWAIGVMSEWAPTYNDARLKGDAMPDKEVDQFNAFAAGHSRMLRSLADENLRAAVANEGGNIDDPYDTYRLKDRNTACKLAFTLGELAASVEAWGLYDLQPLVDEARLLYAAYAEIKEARPPLAGMVEQANRQLASDVTVARAAAYVERMNRLEAEAALKARSAPLAKKSAATKAAAQERQRKLYDLLIDIGITDEDMMGRLDQRRILRLADEKGAIGTLVDIYPLPALKPDEKDYPVTKKASSRRRILKDDVGHIRTYLVDGGLPWTSGSMLA